ncbi:MAG TPA: PPOX class F420-dependent oxidoreductase [Actinomycetota bacterium]
MEIEDALEHFRANGAGVLTTLREDGQPHASVVFTSVVDGALWISSTQDRVKTRNVRNDPRVAFTSGVRPWAGVEGVATIHDGDDVLERLRTYYRAARGEHPDWDDYDRAMREERRLIIQIDLARAYGDLG